MYSKKTLIAAAALAVLSVAGLGSASAAPWEHRADRIEHRQDRFDHRMDRRSDRFDHRRHVSRYAVERTLRFHNYRLIGNPYFMGSRYVVRTHDRFGRVVLVRIDPYTGAFLGVIRL